MGEAPSRAKPRKRESDGVEVEDGRPLSLSRQQRGGDRRPFLGERRAARRLAGAAVPVAGVAGVAFFAVEIGVDPIAGAALVGLRQLMRAVPVALGLPPQRLQRGAQALGRRGDGERSAKGGEIHGGLPAKRRPRSRARAASLPYLGAIVQARRADGVGATPRGENPTLDPRPPLVDQFAGSGQTSPTGIVVPQ